MVKLLFLLILFTSCSRLTPEEAALKFMSLRYEDPLAAYKMIEPKDISQADFMRQHEEMLRVKEYQIHEVIKFKTLSVKKEATLTLVEVETTRPDILKIFKGFYEEKLAGGWKREKIKEEMLKRLKAKDAPTEKIKNQVRVEEKEKSIRIRWP